MITLRGLALSASLLFIFALPSLAQSPADRVADIQKALREAKLSGWLFYDFRGSDPLAYRILKLDKKGIMTRRWFYYIPATGEPTKIVHSIERDRLDSLPGAKKIYLPWQQLQGYLRGVVGGIDPKKHINIRVGSRKIAMQYSPNNDIPYISRVDAGTIELLRSFGVQIMTSADLVQQFEAVWTEEQLQSHIEASEKMQKILMQSFAEIARRIKANIPTTEWDIEQFAIRRFDEENMTSDGDAPIVAVNANAANPHYEPTAEINSPIKRGDWVLLDFSAKLKKPNAVYTDQTFTGYIGETVPQEYVRIFNIVIEARDAAIAFVKTSIASGKVIYGWQIDDVARAVIKKAGYADQFTHRTGHSIGQEVHGNGAHIDNLETRDSRRIVPRTCFSIEPGIYLIGKFGVRSEIDLYVDEKEARVSSGPVQTEIIAILRIP